MNNHSSFHTSSTRAIVSRVATFLTLSIGIAVLCGWIFDIPTLKSVFPTLVSMKANTAIAFTLSGIALWFLNKEQAILWQHRVAQVCAGLVALLGGLTLCQYVFRIDLGVDQLFFTEPAGAVATVYLGRMAPATAFNFMIVGIGLVAAARKLLRTARVLTSIVAAVALFSVIGYLFEVSTLYSLGPFTPMALHTALAFFFITVSYTSARVALDSQFVISAGFSTAIVALVFIGITSYWRTVNQVEDARWVAHTHQVVGKLEEILSDLKDVESSARGFALMGENRFLQPYYVSVDLVHKHVNELDRLTEDNLRQQGRDDSLKPFIAGKLAFMKEVITLRKEKGETAVRKLIATMRGVQLMDEIRVKIREMKNEENELLNIRAETSELSGRDTISTIILGDIVSLALLLVVFLLLVRENRVRVVAEKTLQRANEELEIRVEERTSGLAEANRILRESEERFRLLVESTKDYAIFMLDPEGRIVSWNEGAERIKGYRAEEIVGRHFSCFYPTKDVERGKPNDELRVAAAEGRFEDEGWRVRKDGTQFLTNSILTALRDDSGKLRGFSKITRDITERKRAEEALRNAEKRYRTTLDQMLEGCQIIGSDWRYLYVNDVAATQGRRTKEELIGHTMMEVYPGIENTQMFAELRRCIQERVSHRMENEFIFPDGIKGWFNLSMEPVSEGVFILSMDITEEKRLDEELKKHRDHLEELVKDRTAQLEVANKELEAFAYSVSHDLRAPLRAIDGFSEVLLQDYSDKLDEQGKDHFLRVRRAVQRMAQLIEDMLNLSRVTRAELHRTAVDLSAMARTIAAELQKAEPNRQVEFLIPRDFVTQADERLMRVVLDNLLGNAWKFTSKNPCACIEFGALHGEDGKTTYYVRDNGVGFDMRYADKLFGPFQRLHSMTEFSGTGVGLATVQRIIHRHGGSVWAEGAVERGATVHFTL